MPLSRAVLPPTYTPAPAFPAQGMPNSRRNRSASRRHGTSGGQHGGQHAHGADGPSVKGTPICTCFTPHLQQDALRKKLLAFFKEVPGAAATADVPDTRPLGPTYEIFQH